MNTREQLDRACSDLASLCSRLRVIEKSCGIAMDDEMVQACEFLEKALSLVEVAAAHENYPIRFDFGRPTWPQTPFG